MHVLAHLWSIILSVLSFTHEPALKPDVEHMFPSEEGLRFLCPRIEGLDVGVVGIVMLLPLPLMHVGG